MNERTIVITGASDGIGRAAARALHARPGTRLVLVGRDPGKIARVGTELGAEYHACDYSSLEAVRRLADELATRHPRIDVLANNAGGVFGSRMVTGDGYETTFQVNHLAGLLLTERLEENLRAGEGTVIFTASMAAFRGRLDLTDLSYERGWGSFKVYGSAKLANIVTARALERRWASTGLHAVSFHPGVVATSFGSGAGRLITWFYGSPLGKRMMRTPEQGADTLVWLATTKAGVDWRGGGYYVDRRLSKSPKQATDDAFCDRFLEASDLLLR